MGGDEGPELGGSRWEPDHVSPHGSDGELSGEPPDLAAPRAGGEHDGVGVEGAVVGESDAGDAAPPVEDLDDADPGEGADTGGVEGVGQGEGEGLAVDLALVGEPEEGVRIGTEALLAAESGLPVDDLGRLPRGALPADVLLGSGALLVVQVGDEHAVPPDVEGATGQRFQPRREPAPVGAGLDGQIEEGRRSGGLVLGREHPRRGSRRGASRPLRVHHVDGGVPVHQLQRDGGSRDPAPDDDDFDHPLPSSARRSRPGAPFRWKGGRCARGPIPTSRGQDRSYVPVSRAVSRTSPSMAASRRSRRAPGSRSRRWPRTCSG